MTLLTVIQGVCPVIGVSVPQSIFSGISTNRTMQELLALANEVAQTIAYDTREWTQLVTPYTIDGTGAASYPLPANYKRMLLNGNVWASTYPIAALRFINSMDEWQQRRMLNRSTPPGEWMFNQGQLYIWPLLAGPVTTPAPPLPLPLAWANATAYTVGQTVSDPLDSTVWTVATAHTSAATGLFADDRLANPTYWTATTVPVPPPIVVSPAEQVRFSYLDKNCIKLASTGYGDRFMADGDSFRLDERVLKLGMIWRWKQQKGSAYAEDLGTYGDALNNVAGADKPAPLIIGRLPPSRHYGNVAYPWPVPTS